MEILKLNIMESGFTIINSKGNPVFSQFDSYDGAIWDTKEIATVAEATFNQFLNQAKSEVIANLATYRYNYQITPIGVKEGSFSPTDTNMSRLADLISSYESESGDLNHYTLTWKVSNTQWIELDISTAKALQQAARVQIQRAFNREYAHFKGINKVTTFEDLAVYDYTTGWDDVAVITI